MSALDKERNDIDTALLERAKTDNSALETLLASYDGYISKLVSGFTITGYQWDDLMQEARSAFCSAVKAYRLTSGVKFSTYAAVCINNRLGDLLKGSLADKRAWTVMSIDDEDVNLELASDELGPEEKFIEEEMREEFFDVVKEALTDFEYKVTQLFLEGYKYKDIAHALEAEYPDATAKSVDNALSRAKNKLKELL